MIPQWLLSISLLAAVGSGLIAGTFFAFSVFIMRALARLPVPQGIAAMQSINRTVLNPAFLAVFLGTMVLGLVLSLYSIGDNLSGLGSFRFGAMAYFACVLIVTLARNVPLNERLDKADPEHGEEEWSRYLSHWTFWNHVRTAGAILALFSYLMGFLELSASR